MRALPSKELSNKKLKAMKPKAINIFKYTALFIVLSIAACSPSDFEDLNVNPNQPSQPVTSALLTSAQKGLIGNIITQSTILTAAYPNLYVQFLSDKQYTENSRYSTISFNYGAIYTGPLDNLQSIINLNTDPETAPDVANNGSNANQIAVARILKAYLFLHLTDRFGDIPYSEALQRTDNFRPKFDTQQEIYNSLFTELKEAVAQMDNGAAPAGDIMFGGDLDMWRIFANTMRMVMALRISKVDAQKGQTEFVAAMNDGVITSNDENITFTYLADDNNDNPWEDAFETRLDYAISSTFEDKLTAMNDPRLAVFANPATASGTFVGMPYGIEEAAAGAIANSSVSFLGDAVREQTSTSYIYTYAQVLFSLAEAAHLGWIPGGEAAAADYYLDGIAASWEQWGVDDDAEYAGYVAQASVAYTPATAMEKIGTQKWIALYLNGYEAWAEWRRIGYPVLSPAPASLNPGGIPRRQAYPSFEATLNSTNYNEAVSRLGEDDLDSRVWWDQP
jgi:hypothetical protein